MVGPFGLKPKGTMAVRALPLAKALAARGHEVTLVLPPWSHAADAEEEWVEGGVRIVNTTISPRARIPLYLLGSVRAFHPDVVHIFKPKAYAGLTQWLLWQMRRAGLERTRIVLDTDDWEGAGGWNELEGYTRAQKKFFAWQEGWGLKHADAVTIASRALETIVWSLGVARDRVLYLPNGVNGEEIRAGGMGKVGGKTREDHRKELRDELGLGDAQVILLYTRFFEFELARVGMVLGRVFRELPNAKLLLVGKGLFGEEKRFLELASAGGWWERVVNAGWVERNRLPDYFAACDAAVFPFDDTLVNRCKCSVKLIDLLANGVPVVAEAVGQIREYIRGDENGILVAPSDVDGFARNVVELLKDKERQKRLGERAAETIAKEYDWRELAERVERVYAKSFSSSSSVGR